MKGSVISSNEISVKDKRYVLKTVGVPRKDVLFSMRNESGLAS